MIENFKTECIHGDKFADFSDFIFTENRFDFSTDILKKNCILFCHTDFIHSVFNFIRYSDCKYVVITHNSDYNINDFRCSLKPKNVIYWFAQNVEIKKDDLIPIPIGLERPHINPGKLEQLLEEGQKEKAYSNLLYIGFSPSTNFQERQSAIDILSKRSFVSFVRDRINFNEYIKNIHSHKFVLSPPGNGLDCHRTWEALYCNTIPIVKDGALTQCFKDLPILIVKDWEEITEDFLNIKFIEINEKKLNKDKLKISYWKETILKAYNSL